MLQVRFGFESGLNLNFKLPNLEWLGLLTPMSMPLENIPIEIHSLKFTEIESIYVAFQVGSHFQ